MKKVLNIVIVSIVIVMLCFASGLLAAPSRDKLLKEAYEGLDKKDYSSVEKKLNELDKISPNDYEGLCAKAMLKANTGHVDDALHLFSKAIAINKKNYLAYSFYGDTMKSMGMIPYAEDYYKETISLCPDEECKIYYGKLKSDMLKKQRIDTERQTKELMAIKKYPVPKLDGRKWKVGNLAVVDGLLLAEFVLDTETINKWSEIYTHEVNYSKGPETSIENFMRKTGEFNEQSAKNLNLKYYQNVIFVKQNAALYTWGLGNGKENNIVYLINNGEGLFKVTYGKKTVFTDEEIKKWSTIMMK